MLLARHLHQPRRQSLSQLTRRTVSSSRRCNFIRRSIADVGRRILLTFFNGNQAHLTGTAKNGKAKLSFTVDVTDNGEPGTLDTFSIQVSNGYSASGNLTDGNITIH